MVCTCRSPCGERGLKSSCTHFLRASCRLSLPVRGAWVEIALTNVKPYLPSQSLPVRGAWVEITIRPFRPLILVVSLPVRGAWVEMVNPAD